MTRRKAKQLPEHDATTAALLFAVDPHGLGGAILRGRPGPARTRWLRQLQALLPVDAPWHKVPVNVSNDRLLGGLDFAGTISSGKPLFTTGLLEAVDGGVLVLAMAERIALEAAAIYGMTLDGGEVQIERDGTARRAASRFGVVALDEGLDDDERLVDCLSDRMAFSLPLDDVSLAQLDTADWTRDDIVAARKRLHSIRVDDAIIDRLCASALAFGIPSARAELLALRAARVACALRGGRKVSAQDAALAARLVLPQRAQRLPASEDTSDEPEPPQPQDSDQQTDDATSSKNMPDEVLVDAIRAAIPAGLLDLLQRQSRGRRRSSSGGRGGPKAKTRRRGRPVGVKACDAPGSERLNVLATLKAAAPWQRLRSPHPSDRGGRLKIRKEDLRVTRFQDRVETTTVFAVDASGSQAAQRLAEVKGAIELLLSDCYVRRDQVALIAFRGTEAEVLLSPTRALARARRSLAALPGGGGTPLAAGIDSARELAESIVHHGRVPAIVLLTDGRANISREQEQGAPRAEEDALAAGRLLQMAGFKSLLVDTSRRPRPRARELADAMGAHYVPLPYADAATISATVQRSVG